MLHSANFDTFVAIKFKITIFFFKLCIFYMFSIVNEYQFYLALFSETKYEIVLQHSQGTPVYLTCCLFI